MIDRIDHLVVLVRDAETSCRFYGDVLGMKVVTYGDDRKALTFGRQRIHLQEVDRVSSLDPEHPTPGSGDFCLVTGDPLDRVLEHLRSCGVGIVTGPVGRTGALGPMESVYIRDPDGNLVEISHYTGAAV